MKKVALISTLLLLTSCSIFSSQENEDLELQLEVQKEIVENKINTLNEIKQDAKEKAEVCIPTSETKIYAYMYHYIRKNIDTPQETFYNNVTIVEDFEEQMERVKELEDEWLIKTVFSSELEIFAKEWCYPNKNIVVLFSDDGWDDTYKNLFPIVTANKVKFNVAIITWNTKTEEDRYFNFMTEKEVKEMAESEFTEIVSHSVSHWDLRLFWEKGLQKEVCESKTELEELGIKTNTFIYPAWKYNQNVIKMLRNCWYDNAFTTINWINNAEDYDDDKYELKRIRVLRSSTAESLFKYFKPEEKWESK